MNIFYEGQVLWSQIDANQHMRHSAYADFGAQARLNMFESVGIKTAKLFELKIGPLIFREEVIYLREVVLGDLMSVTCEVTKSRADGSRWSLRQELYRQDGVKAAIINLDGAWIDTVQRRLTLLPPNFTDLFFAMPRSDDYTLEIAKPKA